MAKLSVVLATYNEEKNIEECLESVKGIADEIVIVDGSSQDKTQEIAERLGARVIKTKNHPNFHINKKLAMDEAKGGWVLQLDADERVSRELAEEIKKVINFSPKEAEEYQAKLPNKRLFLKHQKIVESRDGQVGDGEGEYNAYFLPRLNYFLGSYLRYGGVYPDGVIRLVRRDKAYLPAKDVHEQMVVNGKVGWVANPLYHIDSPTFKRYLEKNSRYINLIKDQLKRDSTPKNLLVALNYFVIKPIHWFLLTQIRHKGILDGFRGIVFSFFSALRFPRAYWRYLVQK